MRKRMLVLGMVLSLLFGMSVTAYGADLPTATFDGSDEIKYNYSDLENFGSAFSDMLPGEERSQEIVLKNTGSQAAEFYMQTEVLRAFEEAGAQGAAYTVSLSLEKDGEAIVIYGGETGATVGGADGRGLYDLNGQMNEWVRVADLQPGKSASLFMTVLLDGESATNDYMGAEGTLQFEFRAGYDDTPPETVEQRQPDTVITRTQTVPGPTVTETRVAGRSGEGGSGQNNGTGRDGSGSGNGRDGGAFTGDDAPIFLWGTAVFAAAAAFVVLFAYRKKQKAEERREEI